MGSIRPCRPHRIVRAQRDEARAIHRREVSAAGSGRGFAVDPCEGTNLCANAQHGSMAVLALLTAGLFNAPDFS